MICFSNQTSSESAGATDNGALDIRYNLSKLLMRESRLKVKSLSYSPSAGKAEMGSEPRLTGLSMNCSQSR